MSLSLSTVALALSNNMEKDVSNIQKLLNVVRKHEKASAAFLADLVSMSNDELKRTVSSLAASYKSDVSKSGMSFAALVPMCDSLHKGTLALRNAGKLSLLARAKNIEGFNGARFDANGIKVLDAMLSSVANLKTNAANIVAIEEKAIEEKAKEEKAKEEKAKEEKAKKAA